jgi:hypothetical protein
VLEEPSKFIELDPDLVRTLLDQRLAGSSLKMVAGQLSKHCLNTVKVAVVRFIAATQ